MEDSAPKRQMITEVEDYFTKGCGRCDRFDTQDCSSRIWVAGQDALRLICLNAGLQETVRWGHPCYQYQGRNIALMSAFRDNFRLTFFNAALLKDPNALLEKAGPNSQSADMMKFTSIEQVTRLAPTILAYLKEAMSYAEAGIKPQKLSTELVLPDELQEAIMADSELAAAFSSLTPGRQRSYVVVLSSAKTSHTRLARIQKYRSNILNGKGALERV